MQNNLEWSKKKLVKFLYSILSRLGVIEKSSPFRRIPPPPPRLDRVNTGNQPTKQKSMFLRHCPQGKSYQKRNEKFAVDTELRD